MLFEQLMQQQPHIPSDHEDVPFVPPVRAPLNTYKLKSDMKDRCCICQDDMITGQEVVTLPCMHSFHTVFHTNENECMGIESWLEKSRECPLCKHVMEE